ncbi:MAG TPA: tyrosine recombinase [Anaerolineae bacterium]|nr:tyrosine recombinase [Anaerolineae bacterium]
MKEQIEQFLEHLKVQKQYSENTLSAYRNDLYQFLAYLGGRASGWDQVRHDTLIDYVMTMKGSQEYAAATVARKVAAVKSFYHYLAQAGILKDDPTAELDSPRVQKRPPRALSVEDVEALLEYPAHDTSPKGLRDRALLELLYATGLRVSEVVALNVDDLNLASATVHVVRNRGRRERIIPIHDRAIEPLQLYLQQGRMQLLRNREETSLFVNHRGERLTRQGLWLIVKHHVRAIGIEDEVTPHTLRHTCAAHLLGKRADVGQVQQIMGHANISTTQAYAHARMDETPRLPEEGKE